MLETGKFVRKPFFIDAVQVTTENISEVAAWSNGEVRNDDPTNKPYIKVRVHRPLNDRQTRAFVGDWVLYAGTGYKVYTPKAFAASFQKSDTGQVSPVNDPDWTDAFPETTEVVAPAPNFKSA